eukprot:CAMPEP_0172204826 /NCGR_PEP_ID=MMETSP1050-20130122/32222_1 /TAXON_ID=233186 /ORGANISM="Cryptomonas curvata, Strain CCAP979/52" /LENGTH=115 /DNA_ID=CAMNT_0012883529 /DNA_START=749 /DNA_END=1093 /DNA_ORIENTATION=-
MSGAAARRVGRTRSGAAGAAGPGGWSRSPAHPTAAFGEESSRWPGAARRVERSGAGPAGAWDSDHSLHRTAPGGVWSAARRVERSGAGPAGAWDSEAGGRPTAPGGVWRGMEPGS